MTVIVPSVYPWLGGIAAPARAVRNVWTSADPTAQVVRFTVLGGLANGAYLGFVVLGAAGGGDVQILNAVGTVGSTLLANELHRRHTFRAVGRGTALAVHLAGSGTAAVGLAASTAALAGYQLVAPQGSSWGAAAVGLAVSAAVGLVRFLVLRTVSTPGASARTTAARRSPPAGPTGVTRTRYRRRSRLTAGAFLATVLAIWPLGGAVSAASTLAGGTGLGPAQPTASDTGRQAPPFAATPGARDVAFAARDAFVAGGGNGTLSVFVTDGAAASVVGTTPDGVTRALARREAGWFPDRPFPTASLVKLFLAEGVLHQARTTGVPLREADGARLDAMLTRSDDGAASQLWVRYDGPGQVRSVVQRYGLTSTAPPAEPGAWGESTISARDVGRFLSALPEQAHPEDAALVLGSLAQVTPSGADGFDQRFGLLAEGAAPPGTPVKQGWMCCVQRSRHLHSVALVGDHAVVLLAEAPAATGWTQLRADLDAAATAAVVALTGSAR